MKNQLWKPGHGIKFAAQPVQPVQPVQQAQPEEPEEPEQLAQPEQLQPVDVIPSMNGIWDHYYGSGINQVALHGFTINELVDLGALAASDNEKNALANNLENDVHPAFSFDKWETEVPAHFTRNHTFPLSSDLSGETRPGNYTANNLVVWRALLPSLRLASKFLENAHIFPWYHAFLHSEIHPTTNVTTEAKTPDTPLRKLHLPTQSEITNPAVVEATHKRIHDISQNIRLGISDGNADPTGDSPEINVKYDGVALQPREEDNGNYRIYVAYQIIKPLLENDIGPSTRLALQFHVALTLLHEFAHVLVFAKDGARDVKLYLDNERISEAGFSFEMNTFGGHPVLVLERTDAIDSNGAIRAGFLLEDWLGTAKGHQWNKPLSGMEADWNDREWREARSIPISFLEELGQEDFWRCFVRRWGADALKVYPWTEGRLVQRSGDALKIQIYSAPEQDQAWLMAAQQVPHKSQDPLSPDGTLALHIANRRINRDEEIKSLLQSRRKVEEQEKLGRSRETNPLDVPPENNVGLDARRMPDPAAMAITEMGVKKPWQVRPTEILRMKEQLAAQLYKCAEDDEHVNEFLKRSDKDSPEFDATKKALFENNKIERKKVRKLLDDALDSELLDAYERMFESYNNMKEALGRQSRPTSEDRVLEEIEQDTEDHCTALLRRALACRERREYEKCCEYCELVLKQDGVPLSLRARTCHLFGLSANELVENNWYLIEAVRLYNILQLGYLEDDPARQSLEARREHAEEMLAEAYEKFKTANATAAPHKEETTSDVPGNTTQQGIKIVKQAQPATPPKKPSKSTITNAKQLETPPKTPLHLVTPKATSVGVGLKPRKSFTGFGNSPATSPTPQIKLDPAPRGMPAAEVFRHRRTFKVINQARHNFLTGDINLAERGFLELLKLQGTSAWQKARCHVFLASMRKRSDRLERAETALKLYQHMLRDAPEDERRIAAVTEAADLVRRVSEEIEWDKSTESQRRNATMSGGIGFGQASKRSPGRGDGRTGTGLATITEDEESEDDLVVSEIPPEKPRQKKKEKPVGFMAGVVDKVANLFGVKRRREEEEDDDDESVGRSRKRIR